MSEAKFLNKNCLKAIRDSIFSNMWSVIRGQFFGEGDIGRLPNSFPYRDIVSGILPIRKTLRKVLDLLNLMMLKRLSESIFFQTHKFPVCKVKGRIQVANCLMAFNLLKIVHPFQAKKHLRT